jgi:DNA-binding NtrC family response regulator
MKSLLLVINEEYLSKGIALALMDHFQSIHTTKNPYEAIEILSKDNIDTVITELNFSTIEVKEYTKKIFDELKKDCNLIIIKDASFQLEEVIVNQNIIIQQKPISIKTIISIINSIKENSIKTKEGEN